MFLLTPIKKVFSLLMLIFSPFKRLFCRRRRHSDTILPLTNHFPTPSDVTHSIPKNEPDPVELQSWNEWGGDENRQQKTSANQTQRNKWMNGKPALEDEPEQDYFQDMMPAFKKPAKILVRKKETNAGSALSSRLNVMPDVPVAQGSDLANWDDRSSAWDAENEDLTWQADEAIREKRKSEREQRQLEQQRKKLERDSHRSVRQDPHIEVVRLS